MRHPTRFLFAAVIVGTITVIAPSPAAAQPDKDVVVVNTAAEPVPVAVQGTPTVLVGNSAVPTVETDNPAFQPFQSFLANFMADGEFNMGDELSLTVPAGKRLVIETVSVIVTTPTGQNVRIRLDASGSGGVAAHHLTVSSESWQGTIDHKGIQSLRAYADAGTTVHIRVARDQGIGIGNVNASISGFLVDLP